MSAERTLSNNFALRVSCARFLSIRKRKLATNLILMLKNLWPGAKNVPVVESVLWKASGIQTFRWI